jgi:hypothetical protein
MTVSVRSPDRDPSPTIRQSREWTDLWHVYGFAGANTNHPEATVGSRDAWAVVWRLVR